MPRKQHNRGSEIDPQLVESMLADGFSMEDIGWYLNVDRSTLVKRAARDPELRAAVRNGNRRKPNRVPIGRPIPVADELESLLVDVLRDVRSLRGRLAA